MARSERIEAEWFLTGGTLCVLLATAGFGYGFTLLSSTLFVPLFVWVLSLAVDGLVLVVRIATAE